MKMMNIGIIIDGYSTGAGFAPVFKDFGIQCIHVQSSVQIPSVYKHTYNPDNYFKHYIYDNDLSELTAKLSNYRPRFVISGAECGVELADLICEELNLPGNGKELSACRRNKYLMQKRIEESGLKTIPSFLANNCSMAKDWASKQATWPVVIKPLKSAGGEDVLICNDAHDVVVGLNRILSRPHNMFGFKNHSAILQPYIQGQEYVINTVSYDGKHKLCEIWQYSLCLRDKFQIYDTASLVEYDETEHRGMIAYAFKVIDALGIKYGPAHVELIKNYAGCFVIEVGARLMGANLPFSFLSKCISTPQSMMTVLAYAAPDQFMLRINEP
jgi:biotin carboxylase